MATEPEPVRLFDNEIEIVKTINVDIADDVDWIKRKKIAGRQMLGAFRAELVEDVERGLEQRVQSSGAKDILDPNNPTSEIQLPYFSINAEISHKIDLELDRIITIAGAIIRDFERYRRIAMEHKEERRKWSHDSIFDDVEEVAKAMQYEPAGILALRIRLQRAIDFARRIER